MISVEIKNFQSIERASFQIDGFTSLVGRSNIGKSALIRAIKCALTGAPVAAFVRHGAACARKTKGQKTCKCHVFVKLKGEGFDLLWEKGDSVNRYIFNGASYPAAERGMPEFLTANFNEVRVGDKDVLLQIADQFNPLFLLDQSGIAVADVLSDMAKLDQVNVAIRLVERDRKGAHATRGVREKDLAEAKAKLANFDGLDVTLQQVRAVQNKHGEIQDWRAKVTRLSTLNRTLGGLQLQRESLEGVADFRLPDLGPLRQAQREYTLLQGMVGRARDQKTALEFLRGIGDVAIPSLTGVEAKEETSQRLKGCVNLLQGFRAILARFQSTPLPTLPPLPSVKKHQTIELLHNRLESLTRNLSTLEIEYMRAVDEEKTVNSEWEALGVCPMCARPFHLESHSS